MALNMAEKYSAKVDERFRMGALTTGLVNQNYDWLGVETVKVFSIPTVGLNDYSLVGTSRYGTPSELGNEVQEMKITQDKSFTFDCKVREGDDMNECLYCEKKIGLFDEVCPYCGEAQYDEVANGNRKMMKPQDVSRERKIKNPIFSEEECLIYGIHPDDEMYRKTMELNVLSKKYR